MLVRINELDFVYRELEQIELNPILSPMDLLPYLKGAFEPYLDQESFWVILLNGANCPFCRKMISLGTNRMTHATPAMVFRPAITQGATSIIVAHNHPSGNINPSPEDIEATKRLVEIGKLMDIPVLDHLIVAPGQGYTSLKGIHPSIF